MNYVLLQIHAEIRECVAVKKNYYYLFIDIVQGFPCRKIAHEEFCQTNCFGSVRVIPLSEASNKNSHSNIHIKATHICSFIVPPSSKC